GINNALWHIPNCEPHTLVRGDTLHTLHLGMLSHMMKWVQDFLGHVRRLTIFNHIWSRLPPFPGTDAPAIATRHKTSCHKEILCVRYLTDFILIAQYTVHTPETIQSMRDYLQDFHKHKEVFLQFRASNGAHYNFLKMYLISHFADQIAKYGSLPQYSTEICEVSHKPLKDAYRRTNHINAVPQIIHAYTRAHSFAMRKRNVEQWI
ncbi:hypothetical protein BGX38DRAFT_1072811, partial [Terfezia claveryi]